MKTDIYEFLKISLFISFLILFAMFGTYMHTAIVSLNYEAGSIRYEIRKIAEKKEPHPMIQYLPRLYTLELTHCKGTESKKDIVELFATIPTVGDGGYVDNGMMDKANYAPEGWYTCNYKILTIK